jgi:hypothetical protein
MSFLHQAAGRSAARVRKWTLKSPGNVSLHGKRMKNTAEVRTTASRLPQGNSAARIVAARHRHRKTGHTPARPVRKQGAVRFVDRSGFRLDVVANIARMADRILNLKPFAFTKRWRCGSFSRAGFPE